MAKTRTRYSVDLIKQMAVCDANYIRLLKILPQLATGLDTSFMETDGMMPLSARATVASRQDGSRTPGNVAGLREAVPGRLPENMLAGTSRKFCIADLEDNLEKVTVEITLLEAFRYTSTLEIVQKPHLKTWMTNPSMLVRAYHDARTAEVISYQGHRNFKPRYPQPNPKMYHADEKMQINQFLGEWLSHCLREGRSLELPEFPGSI